MHGVTGKGEKIMKVIAVMSPKGGIGKTTTADSIAYLLGQERGRKVLLIDGDPQGDTSKIFGRYDPEVAGMCELLEHHQSVGGRYRTEEVIQDTDYDNIDIITANGYLMQTDANLLVNQTENQITRLQTVLKEVSGDYDYCICDCGRLLDMVVINILLAAELVIAPVKMGGFEIEAIGNLQEQLTDLTEINKKLRVKVLLTMQQKNKTAAEFEQWMRERSGFDVFGTVIRRSIVAEKSTMSMKPLPEFSRNGVVTKDYKAVVRELI